jgi:hypothetical protein
MGRQDFKKNDLKHLRGKATVIFQKNLSPLGHADMPCSSCSAAIGLQQWRASVTYKSGLPESTKIERAEQLLHRAEHTGCASVPVTIFSTI